MSDFHSTIPQKAGLSFLLAQVGAHGAAQFAERLQPYKLTPAHAGILRVISQEGGISQQKLAKILGMFPSRLVLVLDEMQHMDLIKRTASSSDRRTSALHLTKNGQNMLQVIRRIGQEHQDHLCKSLSTKERETLSQLLSKIADEQGLTPGVHPGYKQLK
jgi:DNA-binding MarR family transcriptional regulator